MTDEVNNLVDNFEQDKMSGEDLRIKLEDFFENNWENTFKTKLFSLNPNHIQFENIFQNNHPFYYSFSSFVDYSLADYFNLKNPKSCVDEYGLLIHKPFELVHSVFRYGFSIDANDAQNEEIVSSGSTENLLKQESNKNGYFEMSKNLKAYDEFNKKNQRPNYFVKDNFGRILFKGEERADESLMKEAFIEVKEKCFELNRAQYGNLSKSFAYAAANAKINLYLIDHTDNNRNTFVKHITHYNLNCRTDRLRLVFNTMCIVAICNKYSKQTRPKEGFFTNFSKETRTDGKFFFIN